MRRAIYPGSFDPVTNGHLDVIKRGAEALRGVVAIACNDAKQGLFTTDERVELLAGTAGQMPNMRVAQG